MCESMLFSSLHFPLLNSALTNVLWLSWIRYASVAAEDQLNAPIIPRLPDATVGSFAVVGLLVVVGRGGWQ